VAPNSPAAMADLQRGDRLIAIGGNYTLYSITYVYRETTKLAGEVFFSLVSLFLKQASVSFIMEKSSL
jgi:predicted metalloprotease with PDZ domain